MLDHGAHSSVNVVWRERPFSGRVHQAAFVQGLSCAEIVARVPVVDHALFLREGVVCVNGEAVPRGMWQFVRPKSREDIIVTLHMPIRGGGAAKDALRIVAAIALVAVATAITAGAAAGILGPSFAAGTIGASILAGAVTIGGALLLGAFVKPPANNIETTDPEPGAAASLQGNQLRRGGAIPRVVGTHRAFPPLLSQPLVDLFEYDEVVEAVYGFAGPHQLRDFKFGEVFADDIDPAQLTYLFYELRPGEGGIDANTVVMLHFDGLQDSLDFPDSSFYEHPFTATGSVFIDKTDEEEWIGRAAGFFNGDDTGSFVSTPAAPEYFIGTQDFSADVWFEFSGVEAAAYNLCGHVDAGLTAAGSSWYVQLGIGTFSFNVSNGSSFSGISISSASLVTGKHHLEVGRNGDLLVLSLDGVVQATLSAPGLTVPACTGALNVGSRGGDFTGGAANNTWNGWINEFRFRVGVPPSLVTFEPPDIPYRPAEVDQNLVTRYGKTSQPNIILNEHRIANEQEDQATRDALSNQLVPLRSTPNAQAIAFRGSGFDEVWIMLSYPAGLSYFDEDFSNDWFYGMAYRIRVRSVGAGSDEWFNCPEVHIHDRRTAQFLRLLVFRWDSTVELSGGVQTETPPPRKGWKAAYTTVPTQTVSPAGIGGWEASEHFYAGSGDTYLFAEGEEGEDPTSNLSTTGLRNIRLSMERVEFFLDGLLEKGPIEVEIRRSQLYVADKFDYATYDMTTTPPNDSLSDGIYDLFGYALKGTSAVIILKQSNAGDQVAVIRASTVWNRSPIGQTGTFASVYVRAQGRSLDALSVLASGLVPDWNGTEWTGLNVTSNPAPHYRDVLVGDLNDNRIPEELVDDSTLVEWRTRCTAEGFNCNGVFEAENVSRVLEVIGSCGYARPRQAELWDVAQDRDFSEVTPVQLFSPRNMRGFRWEKAFVRRRPDGLRVRFNDSTDNYVEKTIVVPRHDVLAANVGRLEEIKYDGLVTEREAVNKATYDQRQVIDRFTFYYAEVDVENLVCRRGDLVLVQHDILDQYAGFSRVLSFTEEAATFTEIVLDGSVPTIPTFFTDDVSPKFFTTPTEFFSSDVGVALRLKDGTTVTFEASVSEDGFTLTPNPPLPISGITTNLERECLVTTGRLLKRNRRMIVYDISPSPDLTARITFVDEAPELWNFLPEPGISGGTLQMFQQYVDVLHQGADNRVQLSQQYVDLVHSEEDNSARLFQQYVEVVHSFDG